MKASCRFYQIVLLLVLLGSFHREAYAAKHVVGGSQGWDESTDFSTWASSQTFKVGDQLEFKYSSSLHSVVELGSESAYKSCDIGSSVNSLSTGSDTIKLDKPGTRYFACGTSGHCQQGMKVKIKTVGAADSSSSSPSSSSSTTPSSTSSTSTSAGSPHRVEFLGFFVVIVSFMMSTIAVFVV